MAEKAGTKGTSREKLPADRLRRTVIMLDKHSDYIDRVAYWDRQYVMEVIGEAVEMHRKAYIKKHGEEPKPIPKRRSQF